MTVPWGCAKPASYSLPPSKGRLHSQRHSSFLVLASGSSLSCLTHSPQRELWNLGIQQLFRVRDPPPGLEKGPGLLQPGRHYLGRGWLHSRQGKSMQILGQHPAPGIGTVPKIGVCLRQKLSDIRLHQREADQPSGFVLKPRLSQSVGCLGHPPSESQTQHIWIWTRVFALSQVPTQC